jgi:Phosphotransferase enzyme family
MSKHSNLTCDYYLIIPNLNRKQILFLSNEDKWSLPKVESSKDIKSFEDINKYVNSKLGVQITLLRCYQNKKHPLSGHFSIIYECENHSPSWNPPSHGRWIGLSELKTTQLLVAEHYESIANWFMDSNIYESELSTAPWLKTGWYKGISNRVGDILGHLGINAMNSIEQQCHSTGGCVLRIVTNDDSFYFKTVRSFNAYEILLTQELCNRYPMHFPKVLFTDLENRSFLMKDIAGTELCSIYDIGQWEEALRVFAQIQIDLIEHTGMLLNLGCTDRSLAKMALTIDSFLEDAIKLQSGRADEISREQIEELHRLFAILKEDCGELEGYGIPPTLVHNDFHPHNIFVNENGSVYLDWTESSISHPFFCPAFILQCKECLPADSESVRTSLREAYLQPWLRYKSKQDLDQAFKLSLPLTKLYYAMTYFRCLINRESDFNKVKSMLPSFLTSLIHDLNEECANYCL